VRYVRPAVADGSFVPVDAVEGKVSFSTLLAARPRMLKIISCLALVLAVFVPATSSAAPADDDINAVLKALGDAFNKGDAKAAAALFAENGDLISPFGVPGKGREGAEKVMAGDMAGALKGTTNTFTAQDVKQLAPNVYLVDVTHESQGMMGPDGKKMDGKLHLVLVMSRGKDKKLMIQSARPYMFMPPPTQGAAMH
jgi:uncharacterized protein (TIGR02246 family)